MQIILSKKWILHPENTITDIETLTLRGLPSGNKTKGSGPATGIKRTIKLFGYSGIYIFTYII